MTIDWAVLNQLFIKESARTGITVKAWCKQLKLNYNTARRHIKSRANFAQSVARKKKRTQNVKYAPKMRFTKSYKQKVQSVNGNEIDAPANNNALNNAPTKKRVASLGNQNARKYGHYSTFITTEDDVRRYLSAQTATLRDELNIARVQLLHLMGVIKKIKADINGDFTVEQKVCLRTLYDKFHTHVDVKIARIESLENSLVNQAKMKADTERSIVLTRKAQLEADKLSCELGNSEITFDEIYDELLQLGDDGLMNH